MPLDFMPPHGSAGSMAAHPLTHTAPTRTFAASVWASETFCVQIVAARP